MTSGRWLVLIAIAVLSGLMVFEVLGLTTIFALAAIRGVIPGKQWFIKGVFSLGLLSILLFLGVLVHAFVLRGGIGFSTSVFVIFVVLAVETALLGFFVFSAPWRFFSLGLIFLGALPFLVWNWRH